MKDGIEKDAKLSPSLNGAVVPTVYEYDIQTEAGKEYSVSAAQLTLAIGNRTIMSAADFGLSTNHRYWNGAECSVKVVSTRKITEDYVMKSGKRLHCTNEGLETVYALTNKDNDVLHVEMRQYKDGFAFRYVIPSKKDVEVVLGEATAYNLPNGARRWMQQYDRQGYEHFFPLNTNGVSPESEKILTWGYPALAEVGDGKFVLFSESNIQHGQCGSFLKSTNENRNRYEVTYPNGDCPVLSEDGGTPWRVVIAGSLADIVESTLVNDVAEPSKLDDAKWVKPGISSWIYWAYNHGSQDYQILKQYVDLAKEMSWPYTLIDAEWDVMKNGGKLKDIVKYSVKQGVAPMIWYNSTTNWTGQWAPTPQGLINKHEDRMKEFKRIAKMGVKGVKIDFFAGDQTETMHYYLDLLEDAAACGLLVNFHGATIPRGWQRTYPNLVSVEAVYGAEWYNNNGVLTNKAACHNATLPFTRNVVGSMDYTPGTFTDSQHPHITTHAHELALTVLFESGIQHMPDRPEAYRSLPSEVKDILRNLPSVWEDTRLLAGYPGDYVVIARRSGNTWYVAGINGTDNSRTIDFSLDRLGVKKSSVLKVTDASTQKEFNINTDALNPGTQSVKCEARGGFLFVINASLDNTL